MTEQFRREVTLPNDADEILQRLKSVLDEDIVVQRIYPSIMAAAGRRLAPLGIINLFLYAIDDYMQPGYTPLRETLLLSYVPGWIDALIDDKEVAEVTKQLFQGFIQSGGE